MQSNLDAFLRCTTPVVESQFLPKSEMKKLNGLWQPWERERVEYFRMGDLWNCYDEWSAYGAGVPIRVDSRETLVQYYVPYLSAVQIFTSKNSSYSYREESEWRERRDWCSESFCSEESSESLCHLADDRLGHLYFQYFETSAPYARIPLMDKVRGLAERYQGLMSLRSVDVSPASWMAVAWYPIYHIPMGRRIKDLGTCFLTYHTLSSSFQYMDDDFEEESKEELEGVVSVGAFGMATYKMTGNLWVSGNEERLLSMLSVADSWLKQLTVSHHDFNYFLRNANANANANTPHTTAHNLILNPN